MIVVDFFMKEMQLCNTRTWFCKHDPENSSVSSGTKFRKEPAIR